MPSAQERDGAESVAARRGPLVRLVSWPFPFLAVATLAVLALRALYL